MSVGNITMNSKDVLSAKLAEIFVTIDGRRYLLFQAKDFEGKFNKTKKEIGILGRTGTGNRSTGWKGTGKLTIYKNTSIFDKIMERYKNTGEDVYFDTQVTNDDPSSAAGSSTVIFKDCNVDGGLLAAFDVDGDFLEQEIEFTFEDFSVPKEFKLLPGM